MAAKPHEMATRAAFGAGVSVVAAIIGVVFGARVGGLFLACPAILPATLTLIEKKEGKQPAEEDEHGSIAGALGLVAFAGAGSLLIHPHGVVVALVGASLAWLLGSMGAYAVHLFLHGTRARGRLHDAHRG
ncbi:MAG: hypothetical protein QOG90_2130 [Actinomycetota bacterium]|jgi:sterol desaturase/sphingolipid hydroxylase (fatty acid hydroxylase superfamily)